MISRIKTFVKTQRYIKHNFPDELLLFKGKHVTNNANQSIMYFTVHRCASQFILNILRQCAADTGMTYVNIASYFWRGGKLYGGNTDDVFKRLGYIYGPFYGLDREEFTLSIPKFDDFKILLMLRDPRDVLTSYYFHHAYELYDNPAKEGFVEERSRETLSKTIDEWVIDKSTVFRDRYRTYLSTFADKPNVFVSKYEDMIRDFNTWLDSLQKFMHINVSAKTLSSIMQKTDFCTAKEDVKAHKRQVVPGDHMRKLKKETISHLNSEFKEILETLKYPISEE
ncbi:MAG: sulfotransferase domain-containing protein [Thermodesulfovibrionales bacterium]|nr:sulfotransferase domain-containing protein [Thermodesulfovibrionales bacterium]